jgi:hypothetical protein
MTRFNTALAVAEAFSFDFATMDDYRYQPTRTPCAVYTVGQGYFTATNSVGKKPKGNADYKWTPVDPPSGYMPNGWQLWECKSYDLV